MVIDLLMGIQLVLFLFLASLRLGLSQDVEHGLILVQGIQAIAETDDNFICATIDWWPHDKCDYNNCPWGNSSAANLVSILDLFVYNMTYVKSIRILPISYHSFRSLESFAEVLVIAECGLFFSGLVSSFPCEGNPRYLYCRKSVTVMEFFYCSVL